MRASLPMQLIQKTLEDWIARDPDKTFITETETGNCLTYRHYLEAVFAMRHLLGTSPRCILLAVPGGLLNAVVWTSALTGGHTVVPIASDASENEVEEMIRRYRPDIVIAEEEVFSASGGLLAGLERVTRAEGEALIQQVSRHPVEGLPEVEGSVILHTSGSTGEPKGVRLQAHQIAWTAWQIAFSHKLTPQDRGLTCLPFFHVNAPVVSLYSALVSGSEVVIAPRFSRRAFWSWVERYRPTWVSIVPTILTLLLETEKPASLPDSLRFVRTASAPLPATRLLAFEKKFGLPVIETYGLTEAASQVTANPIEPGRHKPGSVGLPVGVSMRICRLCEKGAGCSWQDVERGEVGEICFCGPSVIQAYVGQAGEDSFQDGWFRTGDLGYQDSAGYLFITGRVRDVIIRGGENIAPREVEEVLENHPAVREAAVVGRPDSLYGEVVVAYIMAWERGARGMEADLRQYASEHLNRAEVPVDFQFVETLPRTAAGKVSREHLRMQEAHRG